MRRKDGLIFLLGAVGYPALELLWRQHTHWSMGLLGGLCLWMYVTMIEQYPEAPDWALVVFGTLFITTAELGAGLVLNGWLGLGVWNYHNRPWNLFGQICVQYTLCWAALCAVLLPVCRKILRLAWLNREEKYAILRKTQRKE